MRLSSFLHTVKWFQVLVYNSENLTSVICLHTVCSISPIDITTSGDTTPGHIYVYTHTYIHRHIQTHTYIYVCVCMCMCIYTIISTYV